MRFFFLIASLFLFCFPSSVRAGFIENTGQLNLPSDGILKRVYYYCTFPSGTIYLTNEGLFYVFQKSSESLPDFSCRNNLVQISWAKMNLKHAEIHKDSITVANVDTANLFFYNAASTYSCKQYSEVLLKNVYPGIDWVLRTTPKGLKYEFIVHPGSDPSNVVLEFESEQEIIINNEGNIVLTTPNGILKENAPVSFQKGNDQPILTRFIKSDFIQNKTEVRFDYFGYLPNSNSDFIIDPQIEWGTFLGGSGSENIYAMQSNSNGELVVVGYSGSLNFPLQSGGYNQSLSGGVDVFISKFSPNGQLLWSTCYGGSSGDFASALCFDASGNLFVTGTTESANFPLQSLAGAFNQSGLGGGSDGFLLKFDSNGNRLWATFLGGSGYEY
jgi:hypothetical protein